MAVCHLVQVFTPPAQAGGDVVPPFPFESLAHHNSLGVFLFTLTRNNDDSCLAYVLGAISNLLSKIGISNTVGIISSPYSLGTNIGLGTPLSIQQQLLVLLKRSLKRADALKLPSLLSFDHLSLAKFDLKHVQRPLVSFGPNASTKLRTCPADVIKNLRLGARVLTDFGADVLSTSNDNGSFSTSWLRNLSAASDSWRRSSKNTKKLHINDFDNFHYHAQPSPVPAPILQLAGATAWEHYGSHIISYHNKKKENGKERKGWSPMAGDARPAISCVAHRAINGPRRPVGSAARQRHTHTQTQHNTTNHLLLIRSITAPMGAAGDPAPLPATKRTTTLVFTYGTLKRGFSNHRLLEELSASGDATLVGPAVTSARLPLVCGPYRVPFLLNLPIGAGAAAHRVRGEAYAVTACGLARLDELEGVATGHYERLPVEVEVEVEGARRGEAGWWRRSPTSRTGATPATCGGAAGRRASLSTPTAWRRGMSGARTGRRGRRSWSRSGSSSPPNHPNPS
ncbi:unnamed protein product [Miscanthus lutarioriparius]|uniref:Gamma-glutamylcyclotransferase AIG2-like domain-containing protein n=1 Tax=Miscanthus lutarioriparius TaxID=422564 RepID=A0A811RYR2_9POAL|nr:unnamed protein product [Miscanthus lutarioriparius]